jgi:molybdate transport system ATP-binding protein
MAPPATNDAANLLEFDCCLSYAGGLVLDAVFHCQTTVTVLSGPSGSGKTTILSVIAGLRTPQRGKIQLGEVALFDSSKGINLPPESRRIGYVFQDHLLFPHLRVRENLLYGRRRRRRDAQSIDFSRVVEVLELGALLARLPQTLSGGQKRRVALGRALLSGPRLLLLDEPLTALDEGLKGRILDYIELVLREWNVPMLYVTHDAGELERMAEQVVWLQGGRVVEGESVRDPSMHKPDAQPRS